MLPVLTVLEALVDLNELFPIGRLDAAHMAFYAVCLRGLSKEAVQGAIGKLAISQKFMPTVSDIREALGFVPEKKESPTGKAVRAWDEVLTAVKKGGYAKGQEYIQTKHALEVAQKVGWRNICYSSGADLFQAKQRFIEQY